MRVCKKKLLKFFNKEFYEILSNIKAYQSETASQHCPSQNSPICCTPSYFFTRGSFLILTSSCHVYIHTKCSGFADRI